MKRQSKLILRALEICKRTDPKFTQLDLAHKLGLKSQGQVQSWIAGTRPVPAKHCPRIEELTNGEITRYELCPLVFGSKPASIDKAA